MKKLLLLFLGTILLVNLGMAQTKEKRDVDDFTAISFGVAGDLFVKQGSQFNVTLKGDQDLLDEITTKVSNGKLLIRKPNWRKARNMKLTVYITMPEIDGFQLSGSGNLITEGAVNCNDLRIGVSGSGNVKIDELSADDIDIGISGSGSIALNGSGADMADISISGSGSISAKEFQLDRVDVGISGSGRCSVWVEGSIVARISGSGSVYYKGSPNIDAKSSGSGKVKKL